MGDFRAVGLLEPKYAGTPNGVPHYVANTVLMLPNRITFPDDIKGILEKKSTSQTFPKPIRMTGELYLHLYGSCGSNDCPYTGYCKFTMSGLKVHIIDWQGHDQIAFQDDSGVELYVNQGKIQGYDYEKTFDLTKYFTVVMPIGLFPVKVEYDYQFSCGEEYWGLSVSSLSKYGATGTFQIYGSWGW